MSIVQPNFLNDLILEQLGSSKVADNQVYRQRDDLWSWPTYCVIDCCPRRTVYSSGGRSSGDGKSEAIFWLFIGFIILIVSTIAALIQTIRSGVITNKKGRDIRQVENLPANQNQDLIPPLLVLIKDDFNRQAITTTSLAISTVGFAFLTAATIFAIYMHSTKGTPRISRALTNSCFITGGSSLTGALLLKGLHEISREFQREERERQRELLRTNYTARKLPVQPVFVGVPVVPQIIQGVAVGHPANYIIPPPASAPYGPAQLNTDDNDRDPPPTYVPPPPYNPAAKAID